MFWPKSNRLPLWMLSAAATGLLTVPTILEAQSGLSPATGKFQLNPIRRTATPAAPRSNAPTVPAVEEGAYQAAPTAPATPQMTVPAASGGDSAVQRELQRIYEENGREMPTVASPYTIQRPQGASNTVPAQPAAVTTSTGAVPLQNHTAPPASAPARTTSKNPVVAFFQRLTGRDKPVARTQPPVSRPENIPPTPPTAPSYTPYAGAQPRRLSGPETVVAAPGSVQAEIVQDNFLPPLPGTNVSQVPIQPATPVVAGPNTQRPIVTAVKPLAPVVTGPSSNAPFAEEPVFEAPLIVEGTLADVPQPAAEALAQTQVAKASPDFPDPFPAQSEDAADDLDEAEMESPFSGLKLDDEEEEMVADAATESAPEEEGTLEPLPLVAAPSQPTPAPVEGLEIPEEAPKTVAQAEPMEPEPFAPFESEDDLRPAPVKPQPQPQPQPESEPAPLAVPDVVAQPQAPAAVDPYAAKMQQIRDRGGMKGLKGFCPVTLRDERGLVDAVPEFQSQFRGQKFHFASAEAKAKFDAEPTNYAPAAYGADVVVLTRDKDVAEGTLDYAAWYKGKLYLFASEATHAVFSSEPAKYATPAGVE